MTVRRTIRLITAAACASAVLLASPAFAGAQPGSSGIGDPYFPEDGNGGYNVVHYDIELRYQPQNDNLWGRTTIRAQATQDLSRFNLDFALRTTAVRINGVTASYKQRGKELEITPASLLPNGSTFLVTVEYSDTPSNVQVDGETMWRRTPTGALAVGEPHIAAWWFPSNDHPRDKATYDIAVTVPEGVEAVSNGLLVGTSTSDGWTRWAWRTTKPMATYLAFLAIGQYQIRLSSGHRGQPMVTAYAEGLGDVLESAVESVERTPEVLDFLAALFGEYPFEAQGGVVTAEELEYSLETQTRPVYSRSSFAEGADPYVMVHELVHQWFGNSVSLWSWEDIWLNEGFATYAEWLWSEVHDEGSAQELFEAEYWDRFDDEEFWDVLPGDPGPYDLFHEAVYQRGAMALHALRNEVGDERFLDILRSWALRHRYGNGTTGEFIELAEYLAEQDLGDLFETWLYTRGRPEVELETEERAPAPPSLERIRRTHELLRR